MSEPVNKEKKGASPAKEGNEGAQQGGLTAAPPAFQLKTAPAAPPAGGEVAQRQEAPETGGGALDGIPAEFITHLRLREGDRADVYLDSRGLPTAGVGHLLTTAEKRQYPVGTIIPQATRDGWLASNARTAYNAAVSQAAAANVTNQAFINALASVNFQLGTAWNTEHRNTWRYIVAHEWEKAALEAQDSAWFSQTPVRVRDFQAALRAMGTGGTGAAATPAAGNANATPIANGVILGDDVNVREGAGTSHKAVAQLDKNAPVQVFESSQGWLRIGAGRWVKAEFVQQTPIAAKPVAKPAPVAPVAPPAAATPAKTPPSTPAAAPLGNVIAKGTITGDDVNVRSGAGTSHAPVGAQLDKGTAVSIYERKDGFVRIGAGRWVSAQFVKETAAPAPTTPTTGGTKPPTTTTTPTTTTPTTAAAPVAGRAAVTIADSVGQGGKNAKADVLKIQQLLKDLGFKMTVNGTCGKATIGAIAAFQEGSGISSDAKVDAGGGTLRAMNAAPNGAFHNTEKHVTEDKDAPKLTSSKWTNKPHLLVDTSGESLPTQFYSNMRTLVENMNVIGDNLKGSFTVGCGYRSPSFNSTLEGSAAQSNHQFGRAVDIYATAYTPTELRNALRKLIKEGKIHNGGIGLYSWGCHYDIDGAREWGG